MSFVLLIEIGLITNLRIMGLLIYSFHLSSTFTTFMIVFECAISVYWWNAAV